MGNRVDRELQTREKESRAMSYAPHNNYLTRNLWTAINSVGLELR